MDYIDLFQLHWPDRYVPLFGKYKFEPSNITWDPVSFEESVAAVGEEIQKGKVLQWGLSNETAYGVTMVRETAQV